MKIAFNHVIGARMTAVTVAGLGVAGLAVAGVAARYGGAVALRTGTIAHRNRLEVKATDAPEADPLIRSFRRKGWEI